MSDGHGEERGGGYGKPPKHTQFQKGRSGNPRGRPKGSSMRSAVDRVLDRMVTVTIDGERCKVPVTEAVGMQLVQQALGGDAAARRDLLKIAEQSRRAGAEKTERGGETVITIRDVLGTVECRHSLAALGVIEKGRGKNKYQYQISPWVVEAARARGAVLSEDQWVKVEEFTVKGGG